MHDFELVFLNKNYSSWSMRPWVLLAHLGVPFRETPIYGHEADAPRRLHAASPTGKMPVLRDGAITIWESLAIAEYLAEQFPDRALWPVDRADRAHARALACEMHAGFVELRRNCTMNVVLRTKRPIDPATARDVARLDAIFSARRGPFLFGAFGIVDAMFAPVATRFRSYGIEVSEAAQAYVDTLLAQPSVARFCEEATLEADSIPAYVAPGRALTVGPREHQPDAPCWAVIFSSQSSDDTKGYGRMAERMVTLARTMPGFVGVESAHDDKGFGITVSYWDSLDAVAHWRANAEHAEAQRIGRERFYASYDLRVARVERATRFSR